MHEFVHSFIFLKYFLLFKTNLWHETCWKRGQKSPLSTEEQKGTHTHTHGWNVTDWTKKHWNMLSGNIMLRGLWLSISPIHHWSSIIERNRSPETQEPFYYSAWHPCTLFPFVLSTNPQQIKLHSEQSVRQCTLLSPLVCHLSISLHQALTNLAQRWSYGMLHKQLLWRKAYQTSVMHLGDCNNDMSGLKPKQQIP